MGGLCSILVPRDVMSISWTWPFLLKFGRTWPSFTPNFLVEASAGLFVDGPPPRLRHPRLVAGAHQGTGHADPCGSREIRRRLWLRQRLRALMLILNALVLSLAWDMMTVWWWDKVGRGVDPKPASGLSTLEFRVEGTSGLGTTKQLEDSVDVVWW